MTANKMVSIGLYIYLIYISIEIKGRSRQKVKGATNKEGAKDIIESKPAKGAQKF